MALNDSESNFKLHADSPNLETIGKLVDQPLVGIGKVDATVTGNRHELKAAGTLVGDGLKYGDNGALAVSSQFTATVPELTVADARVTADTHATFVSIAGQDINEVDAKTMYNQKQLDFDATAKQPQRALGVAGSLVLHPDHQEVHLQRLGLQTQGQTWQLAPGSQAAINYGHDAVSVENVTLVNGNQRIAADGTFGGGDGLKVTLTNVDLANIDVMLLRPPQLTGMLNASATVTGTTSAPDVKSEFKIEHGGFRQYRYDSFNGTVDYAGSGLTLDARLQQNPTTFLSAKGYVPTALFKGGGSAADRARAHGAPFPESDRVDLHVESTPIDLAVVQGFTTALTNVTGTVQAKIDIGGSAQRSASGRRRHRQQGRVHRAGDRRRLLEHAGASRPAAGQGAYRQHLRPRQSPERALDQRRSGDPRTGARRRSAVRHRQRLQGHRQQAGQRPRQHQSRDRRRIAGAADRRRLWRFDGAGRPR